MKGRGGRKACPSLIPRDKIPRDKIDDVRERTNLVEVVRRHVELRRAGGGSWKGLCPFHAEKTPSFHVHEQRRFFHCFGCGETGDVFTFLGKIEQRPFMEMLRDLAQAAGVELPERALSPAERQALAEAESERARMLRAMELATRFYEEQLASPAGSAARAYLEGRGISAETSACFRLGYAPAAWDALQKHLGDKRIPPTVTERLGLSGLGARGRYDFFRDRVMLPVLDRQKRPVGFSSRLLDPDAKERKYVNSPDSPLFHKKENLYGLHAALDVLRRGGLAVVVEGNFDVLSLHQAGIAEAVAPMGTALTDEQVALLGRLARRVVVVFDGDEAGERAARKTVSLFVEAEVDGRVARLPSGLDPDDFVRAEGGDAFRRLVDNAAPVVERFIDDLARATEPTVPGRVQALEEAVKVLRMVKNAAARELYAGRLAAELGLAPSQVARELRSAFPGHAHLPARDQGAAVARTAAAAPTAETALPPRRAPPRDELEAFVLLASHPELYRSAEARRVSDLLVDPGMRHIYRTAMEALQNGDRVDLAAWLAVAPGDIREAVGSAVMEGSYEAGAEAAERALRALVVRLERSRVEAEIALVDKQHRDALARGDEEAARAMRLREMELIQTKQGLSSALSRP